MSDVRHPNLSLMGKLDIANLDGCSDVFSSNFVWHYFNTQLPALQGSYHGVAGLKEFFAKMSETGNGYFQVQPVDIRAVGDELVVVHARNRIALEQALSGSPIEFDAVVVWRIVDGKIAEAWDIPSIHNVHA